MIRYCCHLAAPLLTSSAPCSASSPWLNICKNMIMILITIFKIIMIIPGRKEGFGSSCQLHPTSPAHCRVHYQRSLWSTLSPSSSSYSPWWWWWWQRPASTTACSQSHLFRAESAHAAALAGDDDDDLWCQDCHGNHLGITIVLLINIWKWIHI